MSEKAAQDVAVAMSGVVARARALVRTKKLLGYDDGAPLRALEASLEELDRISKGDAMRAYLSAHFPDIGQVGRGVKGGRSG